MTGPALESPAWVLRQIRFPLPISHLALGSGGKDLASPYSECLPPPTPKNVKCGGARQNACRQRQLDPKGKVDGRQRFVGPFATPKFASQAIRSSSPWGEAGVRGRREARSVTHNGDPLPTET